MIIRKFIFNGEKSNLSSFYLVRNNTGRHLRLMDNNGVSAYFYLLNDNEKHVEYMNACVNNCDRAIESLESFRHASELPNVSDKKCWDLQGVAPSFVSYILLDYTIWLAFGDQCGNVVKFTFDGYQSDERIDECIEAVRRLKSAFL